MFIIVVSEEIDQYMSLQRKTARQRAKIAVLQMRPHFIHNTMEGKQNVEQNATNVVVMPGAISINPLNWKLDETYAPASENLGSLVIDEKAATVSIGDIGADAQVNTERGVVVTNANSEPIALAEFFGPASFHNGDYTFYYNNIKTCHQLKWLVLEN